MVLKLGEASLTSDITLSAESFVWGLQSVCQLHRVPFAPALVLQQFPPPYDLAALQHAAKAMGLESGVRDARAKDLPQLPAPFVAVLHPATTEVAMPGAEASAPISERDAHVRLALVVRCTPTEIAYAEHGIPAPLTQGQGHHDLHRASASEGVAGEQRRHAGGARDADERGQRGAEEWIDGTTCPTRI